MGAQMSGPIAKPSTKSETPSVKISCEHPNSPMICRAPPLYGRDERDGQCGNSDNRSDAPFLQFTVVHWVPGVVRDEVDDKGVVLGAGALVVVVLDVGRNACMAEDL